MAENPAFSVINNIYLYELSKVFRKKDIIAI